MIDWTKLTDDPNNRAAKEEVRRYLLSVRRLHSDVIDLMEVLKRSLEGARERKSERGARSSGKRSSSAGDSTRKTSAKKAGGASGDLSELSKDELYERAQQLDIEGRSSMNKAQLVRALEKAG